MNREEIEKILPHRETMLLIDEAYADGETARGRYRVRGDEWFLQGHFPGNPVVPGVILCEMVAQSACVLLAGRELERATPYFTGLDNVRFRKSVFPGDVFETECRITKAKGRFYFAEGKGRVGGALCVSGTLSFAVVKSGGPDPDGQE